MTDEQTKQDDQATTPADSQNTETQTTTEQSTPQEKPTVKNEPQPETKQDTKLLNLNDLHAGQTVKIYERIKDITAKGEERERLQIFEGIILVVKGAGISRTMTVRKVSEGIGVEKIFPVNSPVIAKIELVKTAKVRRAKLSFINDLKSRFKRALKETYVK